MQTDVVPEISPTQTEITKPTVESPKTPAAGHEPISATQVAANAEAAENDRVTSQVQTAEIQHELMINRLFADTDPRKELASMYPPGIHEQTLIDRTTQDYISKITGNYRLPNITITEAQKAHSDILLEKSRQQRLVDEAKANNQPVPEGIILDENGKVKVDEGKIAADSIKTPRILQRTEELKKEGLEPFFATEKGLIEEILNTNPQASYLEIRQKITDRRDKENRTAIDTALDGFHIGLTGEEKAKLANVVDDYRDTKGLVDEKVYDLIKKRAAEIKVYALIAELNHNPLHYQYEFTPETREKIVKAVLEGQDPADAVNKYKGKGGGPTVGSTIGQMFKAIFKEITKSRQ